jgi:putative tricarboxylic transport membrane protein
MSTTPETAGRAVGTRWPELIVAGFLMAVAVLVITDSIRVGMGWADDGPRSGYFPFAIGVLLLLASGSVFVGQLLRWRAADPAFAQREELALVIVVFIPMVVYIGAIFATGIYLASALLIGYFMVRYGKYRWAITLPVAIGVPLVFFAVFEKWFLVPLPKGPIEQWLGL